ncbi:Rz-like lysis system protein LysB [Pseudomonas bohemica]|uniref:Rz-like lysis system protein LysB n=1 Tax=Pseudomonas bohemica TaxID=2044872 RepID=UPI000DA60AA4
MSTLRQALYGLALLCALGLLLWAQSERIEIAGKNVELAQGATTAALGRATRSEAVAAQMTGALDVERKAQAALRLLQNDLRKALSDRKQTIEDLKRENEELRLWADQLLPDAARRLRDRPAITGAAAYRDWLSGSRALRPAGDATAQ